MIVTLSCRKKAPTKNTWEANVKTFRLFSRSHGACLAAVVLVAGLSFGFIPVAEAKDPELVARTCDPKDLSKWKAAAKPVYDSFEQEAGKEWAEKVYRVVAGGYAN